MMSTVSEKLLQVAQNNPKVYHSGQLNIVKNAECLKGSKSGSAMLLDDVSPVTHNMSVKVRGKNLFDISKIPSDTKLTNNGDGTLTIAANEYAHTVYKKVSELCPDLKVGDTICLNFTTESSTYFFYFQPPSDKKAWRRNNSITVTQNDLDSYFTIYGYRATDENYGNPCTISNIQIELGTTATDYTPYVPDLTAVKVKKQGKNLFDYNNVIFKANVPSAIITKENNGFTFTALSSSAYFNTSNISAFCLKPNTTYTSRATVTLIDNGSSMLGESGSMGLSLLLQTNVTYDSSGKGKIYIVDGYQNNTGVFSTVGTHEIITTFTTPADMTDFKYIVTRVSNNTTVIFKDIQIALGATATDYESYITPTEYIPTADGTVNGVTSLYPNTTLMTDTDGVIIDCEYYKDIDKTFNELTTSVALSGGDS